jgi:hypothetical protein
VAGCYISRDDVSIGQWRERDGETYRAAFVEDCVLTGPEHAALPATALRAEALAEARRQGLLPPKKGVR